MRVPKISIEGMDIHIGSATLHLHLMEPLMEDGQHLTIKRTCPQCNRRRAVKRFGLRHTRDGHIYVQPYCSECRSELSSKKRRAKTVG
jgi:hypothetical protein